MRRRAPLAVPLLLLAALGCGDDGSVSDDGGAGDDGRANGDGSVPGDGPAPGDAGPFEGVRAFPGAQGFGALATGGRGGRVLIVETLAASGPGSLQAALDVNEPRIIVFEVSGVIDGDIHIPYGDVTIAGQTAPGAGITIAGRLTGEYDYDVRNIIIRHLRVRPEYDGSAGEQFDAIQLSRNSVIALDHVSVAFGVDETVDLYEATDVTISWSSIEMSGTVGHPEGEHNYGLINGPDGARVSVHHTLFAHHKNRNPAIANGPCEVIDNVAYDVRHGFVHHNPASGPFNIVGNYYRDGDEDILLPFYFDDENGGNAPDLAYYLADNYIDDPASDCQGSVDDPWTECTYDLFLGSQYRAGSIHTFAGDYYVAVTSLGSTIAYDAVLDGAGAYPRDVVTATAVQETRDRTGGWGARSFDLMDGLSAAQPPADTDRDGMADSWEADHGLSSSDPDDHAQVMPSGYTAIEQYINERAAALTP